VLIDAAQRGEPPGTISVVEPELADADEVSTEDLLVSPHELDPTKVLKLVSALGGSCKRVMLVACEPLTLGGEEGAMGLSEPVAAAIDAAVGIVEDLVEHLINGQETCAAEPLAQRRSSFSQEGVRSL